MNVAEWAWIIVGAIIALTIIIMFLMMIPEMVRYSKLKNM